MSITLALAIHERERQEVRWFYQQHGRSVEFAHADSVVLARNEIGIMVGAVWLDRSAGTCVLRKMHVHEAHRYRGIGRRLLHTSVECLGSHEECWCLPWRHLADFYASARFTGDLPDLAPAHLRDRVDSHRSQGLDVVLLHRPPPPQVVEPR